MVMGCVPVITACWAMMAEGSMTREEGLGRALEARLTVGAGRLVDAVGSAIVGAECLLVFAGGELRDERDWTDVGVACV